MALAAAPALAQSAAAGAASAPRLRFRTRRAACACEGDIDDETIERALAAHTARPAPGAADARDDKSAEKPRSATPNTRRPSP